MRSPPQTAHAPVVNEQRDINVDYVFIFLLPLCGWVSLCLSVSLSICMCVCPPPLPPATPQLSAANQLLQQTQQPYSYLVDAVRQRDAQIATLKEQVASLEDSVR